MQLQPLPHRLSVCKITDPSAFDPGAEFCFFARTDEEISLVCRTVDVPGGAIAREDGWRAFRVRDTLDFSLTGGIAGITAILAGRGIPVFAVSTFNTDYILIQEAQFDSALSALSDSGYTVV